MAFPEPTPQHAWLKQLVGRWTIEAAMEDGQLAGGTEEVRMLGDYWMVADGNSVMPGVGEGSWLMTVGYDPAKGRYVGSWVGSMMTNMWVYDGELDEAANTLSLYSEGPNWEGEGIAKYRDVIEVVDADHRVLRGEIQNPDGSWKTFMTTNFTRVS